MTTSLENRQHLSGYHEQERAQREADARQLVDGIIGRNGQFFAQPENRLEFMQSQDADAFYRIAQYVNAKLRSEKPMMLRRDANEKGGFLAALHTPSHEDKIPAFKEGYRAIQEYITDSSDPTDKKISSVAMATEALVIWTHPFNDGNGRTSRFLGKLIENGATDTDALVDEAITNSKRRRIYNKPLATKEGALALADNEDIMLDDDERDELRSNAETMPNDIDGMYLSVQRLLRDDALQERSIRLVK